MSESLAVEKFRDGITILQVLVLARPLPKERIVPEAAGQTEF